MQIHLAGGKCEQAWWVDSHSEPIATASLSLLSALRGRADALQAIIIERDDQLPPLPELVAEAKQAEKIWLEQHSLNNIA